MKLNRTWAMVVAIVMALTLSLSGTLAYLQDTDEAVNVMTLGNVQIKQLEYQRAKDVEHTATAKEGDLVPFVQGQPLYPAVPKAGATNPYTAEPTSLFSWGPYVTAAGAGNGLWNDDKISNVVDKFVFVENTGKSDAYYRTLFAFECPEGMAYSQGSDKEFMMNTNGNERFDWADYGYITVNGVRYLLMRATYKEILAPGEISRPSLLQVLMTEHCTNEHMELLGDSYEILVVTQAVQAAGFENTLEKLAAEVALDTAFGEVSTESHPWMDLDGKSDEEGDQDPDNAGTPVTVNTLAELKDALDAGKNDLLVNGATIDENIFNGHYYKDRNIEFIDCTFTANMNYMYINDAVFTNCTFDCGSANSAVHYDELFGDLVFNNCTFKSGKIQIGANKAMTGTVTFNECVFEETTSTSIWAEKGIRVYSPATFNHCEFNNRVVLAGSNDLPISFYSCTMDNGTPVTYELVDGANTGIIGGGNIPVVTIK